MWNVTGVRHRSCHLHFSLAGGACRCRLAAANLWVSDSIHMMSHTRAFPWWPGHRTRAVALGSPAPSLDAPATGRSPPDGHKESTDERGEKKLSVWSNETLWMWLNCRVMDKPKHWTNWKLWPDDATRWKVIGSQKNITKVRDCAQEKAWKPHPAVFERLHTEAQSAGGAGGKVLIRRFILWLTWIQYNPSCHLSWI